MADKGGQTTQAGIDYQNKIATLFLGRMIDPGPWEVNDEILEVRNEDPTAEVDDVVVRYKDHRVWIQVKLDMKDTGDTWVKFWKHMINQWWHRPLPLSEDDRLTLAISQTPDWVKQLEEICGRARGSKRSADLATLDQQVAEWLGRLSTDQETLIKNIVADVSHKPRPKKESKKKAEETTAIGESKTPKTGEPVKAEYLQSAALFDLFSHMEVWTQFNPDKIKTDHGRSYMPKATQEWYELFADLLEIVGNNARYGKSISRIDLVRELNQKKTFIVGSTSLIPVAAGLPDQYIHRRGIEIPLVRRLRRKTDATTPQIVGLVGNGGFGKTDLAKAIANDPRVLNKYPDGVLWVEIGQAPDLRSIIENQIKALTGKSAGFIGLGETGLNEAANALADELRSRKLLIVLDDVWQKKVLEYFLPGAANSALLITTRLPETIPPGSSVDVREMETGEAARLLVSWKETLPNDMIPFSNLAIKLGEWPLLLKLAAGTLEESVKADGFSLNESLSKLQERLEYYGFTAFDRTDENDRKKAISISMNISLERLEKLDRLGNMRPRFLELAVFPEEVDIPFSVIEKLWKSTAGMGRIPVEDALKAMQRLSLFTHYDAPGRTLRLHDVIRAYLKEQVKDELPVLHGKLLEGYDLKNWTGLPITESYLWRWLAWHLEKAGRHEELYQLISKDWKDARFSRDFNHHAFSRDVDLAIQAADKEHNLPELARLCLLYATLGELATDVPPEVLGVLARCGQAEAALGYAALVQTADKRCEAYRSIGEGLLAAGEVPRAITVLWQAVSVTEDAWTCYQALVGVTLALFQAGDLDGALAVVEKIKDEKIKAQALNGIAQAALQAGDKAVALSAAQQSLDASKKIVAFDEISRVRALCDVARTFYQAGERESALSTAQRALDEANQIVAEEGSYRWEAQNEVARVLAELGDLQGAAAAARDSCENFAGYIWGDLAQVMLQAGDREGMEQALTWVETVRDETYQAQALHSIAGALAQAGDTQAALQVAGRIRGDRVDKAYALLEVARVLAKAGDADGARRVVSQELEIPVGIHRLPMPGSRMLAELVHVLALAGDYEEARHLLHQIQDPSVQLLGAVKLARELPQSRGRQAYQEILALIREVSSLPFIQARYEHETDCDLAQLLTRAGEKKLALAIAEMITSRQDRLEALGRVAQVLSQDGDREGALATARHTLKAAEVFEREDLKRAELAEMLFVLARCGGRDGAFDQLEVLGDGWYKDRALVRVAQGLAESGDRAGAIAVLEKISNPGSRDQASIAVAEGLALAGDEAGARDAVLAIISEDARGIAWGRLAVVLASAGSRHAAQETAALALATAQNLGGYAATQIIPDAAHALALIRDKAGLRLALSTAESIDDQPSRAQALGSLAQALALTGDQEGLDLALSAAQAIDGDWSQVEAMKDVLPSLAQARHRQSLRLALPAAEKIADLQSRARVLGALALALAQVGDREGVELIAQAAAQIGYVKISVPALSDIAQAFAQSGERERVSQVLAAIENTWEPRGQAYVFRGIAQGLARSGDAAGAWDAVEQISHWQSQEKYEALVGVAQALADAGDRQGAFKTVALIPECSLKVDALVAVAQSAAAAGDRQALRQALTLAEAGDREGLLLAFVAAEKIDDEGYKAEALRGVALALAAAGDREGLLLAFAAAEKIESDKYKAQALSGVAQALGQAGDRTTALAALRQSLSAARNASRDLVWTTLRDGAALLAQPGEWQTLSQVLEKTLALDRWW